MIGHATDNIDPPKDKAKKGGLGKKAMSLASSFGTKLGSLLGVKESQLRIGDLNKFLDKHGQLALTNLALGDYTESVKVAERSAEFQQLELDKTDLTITPEARESARMSFLAACALAADAHNLKGGHPLSEGDDTAVRKMVNKALLFIKKNEKALKQDFLDLLK